MADAAQLKNLKIKTGVVKRLSKEKMCYVKEANQQAEKVEKLKKEKADEYLVRKQEEVLQESRAMVPDCSRRLQTAMDDLKQCTSADKASLGETEEYKTAIQALDDAQTALDTNL